MTPRWSLMRTVSSLLATLLLPVQSGAAFGKDGAGMTAAQDTEPLEEQILTPDPRTVALAGVQKYLRETRSLKARFLQRAPSGKEVEGTLSLARPGRIRFDFGGGVPLLIVADGETLTMIDTEIGQVTRWPVNDTPLRVLLGETVDLASYGASIDIAPGGVADLVALRASDPQRPELGDIALYFLQDMATGTLDLVSWSVIDARGQLTSVQLFDVEKNIALDADLWTFEDPRGLARRRRRN